MVQRWCRRKHCQYWGKALVDEAFLKYIVFQWSNISQTATRNLEWLIDPNSRVKYCFHNTTVLTTSTPYDGLLQTDHWLGCESASDKKWPHMDNDIETLSPFSCSKIYMQISVLIPKWYHRVKLWLSNMLCRLRVRDVGAPRPACNEYLMTQCVHARPKKSPIRNYS